MRSHYWLCSLVCVTLAAAEVTVYRSSDASGLPRYSDNSERGSAAQLPALNTVSPLPHTPQPPPRAAEQPRLLLQITAPANGLVVGNDQPGVRLQLQMSGHRGDSVRLVCLHNGREAAPLGSDLSCWVALPQRGEQLLQVVALDAADRAVAHSDAVLVYVQRHHRPPAPPPPSLRNN